jgi:hypothetical protein
MLQLGVNNSHANPQFRGLTGPLGEQVNIKLLFTSYTH